MSTRFIKKRADKKALQLFKAASSQVPAYKDFLKQNKIDPKKINKIEDFRELPYVDKENYISRYNLDQLSWNGVLRSTIGFPMSSGSSGEPYFWPTGLSQEIDSIELFSKLIRNIVEDRNESVLFISSFALGTWKAGIEVYDSIKGIAENDSRISIVTPSIDKKEAVKQIKHLEKYFDCIILSGYPPFVKDILQLGQDEGINFSEINLYLLTAGEAFSENWRDAVLSLIGRPSECNRLINFYGMAETGIIGFETEITIGLRRSALTDVGVYEMIGGDRATALYAFDPSMRYLETQGDRLLLTTNSGIPLIRYDTRDEGGLLDHEEVQYLHNKDKLSCVYLYGRRDVSATLYGVNIYIENVKKALENKKIASKVSGLFVMEAKHNKKMDQHLQVTVELSKKSKPTLALRKEISTLLFDTLNTLNAEYNKLASSIGNKAKPRIKLVEYGKIQSAPGKKHRWVKKG
jgi:phenylacetate-CoA ligase